MKKIVINENKKAVYELCIQEDGIYLIYTGKNSRPSEIRRRSWKITKGEGGLYKYDLISCTLTGRMTPPANVQIIVIQYFDSYPVNPDLFLKGDL